MDEIGKTFEEAASESLTSLAKQMNKTEEELMEMHTLIWYSAGATILNILKEQDIITMEQIDEGN